jgi:hypothetical protein
MIGPSSNGLFQGRNKPAQIHQLPAPFFHALEIVSTVGNPGSCDCNHLSMERRASLGSGVATVLERCQNHVKYDTWLLDGNDQQLQVKHECRGSVLVSEY